MNEQDVELLLRRWYQHEVDTGKPVPQALRARMLGVPLAYPRAGAAHSGRLVLIAAVALLGTTLLALAVAMGGQLFRLPSAVVSPSPDPTTTPSPSLAAGEGPSVEPIGCAATLDDGVLLMLRQGEAGPGTRDTEMTVFDDGRVVKGRLEQLDIGEQWQQRRLSEGGVTRLLDLIEAAELPNCLRVSAGNPTNLVVARPEAAPLAVSAGSDRGLRPPTDGEEARLAELLAQIDDLDAWLSSDDWLDADWLPYQPRWQVWIEIEPGYSNCRLPNITGSNCFTPGDDVQLPGNTDLTTFGDLHPAQPNQPYGYRCGEVSLLEAEEIVSTLHLVTDDPRDPRVRAYIVGRALLTISVRSFLPHETACEREPQPARVPPEAPPDALPELDPCSYVPTLPQVLFHRGTRGLRTEHWASCYLWLEHGDIDVWMRARPTTAEEAAAHVASIFGEVGVVTEVAGDAVLFTNACFTDTSGCLPAIAISAEPYLFVIEVGSGEVLDEMRPVAEAIRDNLANMENEP